jgi:hypothetical protein
MAVVPRGRHQLVTIETLGQDGRHLWWEGPPAAGAILRGQPVEDTFSLHRATCDDSPAGSPLGLSKRVAVGAAVAYDGRDVDDSLGLTRVKGVAPRPRVPRLCTLALGGLRGRDIGLDRQLHRGKIRWAKDVLPVTEGLRRAGLPY